MLNPSGADSRYDKDKTPDEKCEIKLRSISHQKYACFIFFCGFHDIYINFLFQYGLYQETGIV
ncbi:hypothetical protein GCM10007171_09470 [Dickeya fangzhongdai]|nr:hypothetical protein GCM10007171_09470 [Dickeya fangzhongdai]